MPTLLYRPIVRVVVLQHLEDAVALRDVRTVVVRAPHARLLHLGRFDNRIAGHLDGITVAGDQARAICASALETVTPGQVFATTGAALQADDRLRLKHMLALAETLPDARRGLLSAIAWSPFSTARSHIDTLLASRNPSRRELGISALRMRRQDAGTVLQAGVQDNDAKIRSAAVRSAGELGRADLIDVLLDLARDDEGYLGLQAAHAACLLGHGRQVLRHLHARYHAGRIGNDNALAMLVLASDFDFARSIVRAMPARADGDGEPEARPLIRATGLLGDPALIPWLIDLTEDPKLSRLAGESISMITGVDMAYLDLDRKPPKEPISGPTDDPASDEVALDEDESLPWPDPQRIKKWWHANADRFPPGQRYFCGAPPTPEHALHVLKTGFQRQRALAAIWRCVLQPGTPLFNVAAPAWRQEAELAALS